ncbi:MAG: hypothetical protein II551_05245, partial [Paludibacteraceae bacterium]|nr:hypothetical protein [Paludibacteraceae bacterium]
KVSHHFFLSINVGSAPTLPDVGFFSPPIGSFSTHFPANVETILDFKANDKPRKSRRSNGGGVIISIFTVSLLSLCRF